MLVPRAIKNNNNNNNIIELLPQQNKKFDSSNQRYDKRIEKL